MRKAAIFLALSGALATASQSFADERTGFFPTDILAVGNSYVNAGVSVYSEHSDYVRITRRGVIQPGGYESHVTSATMTVRRGLFENADVTVGLPYQPVYEFTTVYAGSEPQKINAQKGWGSPSFRIAYGLVGDASKPYSVAVALTAVADMMGNSTGSTTPAINLGYKLNDYSRLYTMADLYYPTRTGGSRQQTVRFGGQYDFSTALTLDLSARYTHFNNTASNISFHNSGLELDFFYKITDNFYLYSAIVNEWRSDRGNKNRLSVYKGSSDLRTYALGLRYLF